MIILVDIGNSRIKFALYNDSEFLEQGAYPYDSTDYQEVITKIVQIWQDFSKNTITRVIISNVAGTKLADCMSSVVKQSFGLEPSYIAPTKTFKGLKNGYAMHEALGADRWLNLLGAHKLLKLEKIPGGFCVISCGTAVTIDAVNSSYNHIGGFIIPGLHLMENSLLDHTRDIRNKMLLQENSNIENKSKKSSYFLANNTKHAITGGIHYALIAYIERILEDLDLVLDADYTAFITGGDGAKIAQMLSVDKHLKVSTDLMWHGMISLL